MTGEGLAQESSADPDAAPDMASEIDVRAIRRTASTTQAQFVASFPFSVRTVQQWERGANALAGDQG